MRQAGLKMWDLIYSVCEKELLQNLDNGTKSNSLYLLGHLERKVHEGVPGTESPLLLFLTQISHKGNDSNSYLTRSRQSTLFQLRTMAANLEVLILHTSHTQLLWLPGSRSGARPPVGSPL